MASKVGVLLFNGYQELEFWYPLLRLREEGIEAVVIGVTGPEAATSLLGYPVTPNLALSAAAAGDYAAIVIPGGNVAALLEDAALKAFLRQAQDKGVVLAASGAAAALLPGGKGLTARTTDDAPQWTRALLKEIRA